MRLCSKARTSGCKARTDNSRYAESGITLLAVPADSTPTVTTAVCRGSTLRDTTVCRAMTTLEAATTGSAVPCGMAPCPPMPRSVINTLSLDAIIGPSRNTRWPCGMPGMLCIAKTASHGKRSSKPSSSMRAAPLSAVPYSSAG